MQNMTKNLLAATLATVTISASSVSAAPIVVTTGQTVGGTTTSISIDAGDVSGFNAGLTNDGGTGNLVVTFNNDDDDGTAKTDFRLQWNGAADGLDFSTATYTYMQIDIANVSAGMLDTNWQMWWVDDDSVIAGPSNPASSSTTLGTVGVSPTPFSIVIDLVNGSTSGGTGWGAGLLNNLRIDPYNFNTTNIGKSFEISAITFGSALIPEPGSLALMGLGGLCVLRRRRS